MAAWLQTIFGLSILRRERIDKAQVHINTIMHLARMKTRARLPGKLTRLLWN